MNPITLPPYTEVANALQDAEASLTPAEAHGLFCGLICVVDDNATVAWDKLIPEIREHSESLALLRDVFTVSYQQISEFSLDFMLLLPDDNTDINLRAEALTLFCQGLLTGLRQTQRPMEEGASADAIDALNDVTEIAQMDHGELTANEEDENAYMELVEYVRLAVLMLYHERHASEHDDQVSQHSLH